MLTYEIIEYKEDLAAAVAKMWNESREGWGGDQEVETEEERRTAEATNGNILTLLAFDGDSVIGYCGFSEYKGDEGALYIPLLNVHPDHHGKGIGKKLVLEALKRTTELGWPRLDLYTWPGNTKAVPLYKRCGFFWEERDDRVHLLNFIPKLITHPVLSHYIDSSNWYETLKREIEIKPDGEKNNGFTYYKYQFDTENGEVQAKIEQSGRGISGFSTERYEVDFTLPTHKLLLSGNYEGTLHIQTKQQGSIRVKGTIVDHPYIESTFTINEKVKGTKTFTIPFSIVKAPELEQSKWKTHPKLTLELEIDGEEVVLELGTAIKKPVKLEPFLLQKKQLHSGERAEYYVRVENQLEERQIVQIKVNGIDQPFVLELKSLEKQVLTIPFTVLNTGEMKVDVSITSTLEWLDSSYKEQLSMAIPARNKSFVMESATHLLLYHGENVMKWSKEDHQAVLENALTSERIPLVFLHPIIGKPSSHYLAKKTWDSYTWERHIEGVTLKLNYQLEKPHCRITRVITWSNDGQLTAALNVTNTGESALTKLDTGQLFYLNEEKVIFPIEGTILEADESVGLELLPLNQLSEPWLFIEGDSHTFGVQWPKNANLYTPSWQAVLEQQAEEVEPGVTHEFEPLKIDIDVYANWQVFQQDLKQQPTRKLIDLSFSKHHGFFTPGHEIEIELSQLSKQVTTGKVKVNDQLEEKVNLEGISSQAFKQKLSTNTITNLETTILTDAGKSTYSVKAIPVQQSEIQKEINHEQGQKVWTLKNGMLTFKVAPEYFPSMYSLTTHTKEWLDHSFPKPGPKSWWNPWGGGVHTLPGNVNLYTLLKQTRSASFVTQLDQWGHKWEGIQLDIDFIDHPDWMGMKLRQFFLTLPQSPIVATYYEISHPNQLLTTDEFRSVSFLDKQNALLKYFPYESDTQWKFSGQEGIELSGSQLSPILRVWDEKATEGLTIIPTNGDADIYSNAEALVYETSQTHTATPDTASVRSNPTYYCITDELHSTSGWEWLKQLRFMEGNHESH